MTTVPPPTTPPPQMTAPVTTAPVVQLLSPPPAVAALPAGTTLEALVLPPPPQPPAPSPDAAAKVIVALRTPAGDVQVPLPVQLPKGTEVELQVVRSTPTQVTVRVVTIDQQPAAQAIAQLRQAAQPQTPAPAPPPPVLPPQPTPVPPAAAWTPKGPVTVTNLGSVSGYVVQGTPVPEAPTAPLPTAPTGAAPAPALTTPPAPLPTGVVSALPLPTAPIVVGLTPLPVPTGVAPVPAPQLFALITGGEVALRIVSVQVPGGEPIVAQQQPTTPPALQPVQAPPGAVPSAPITAPTIVAGAAPPIVSSTPAPAALVQGAPPLATPVPGAAPLGATPVVTEAAIVTPPVKEPGLVLPGPQGLPPSPPAPPHIVQPQPALTTLTGVVTSNTAAVPVIQTEAGDIQINLRANLPVGTRVVIEVLAQVPPRGLNFVIPSLPPAALPLSGPPGATVGWPTLTESLAVLQRADPQAAVQLAQVIPDGGARTAVAMISFAQAMRTGDPRQWPGDLTLRALERAGPRGSHLASQLSDEVAALSTRARDTGTEWRALPMPWNADGRIDRIALITRREGTGDDEDAKKKKGGAGGTRFLINLDLSRLGELQLDGMFRKETRGFDMMIRTRAALPDNIRLDLTGLFAASNAAMGLAGGLTFQVVKKFPDPVAQSLGAGQDKSGLWA